METPKITLLAGGVGGAKAAEGLMHSEYSRQLTVIGNIGDDQYFYDLWISPDIDTLIYTLANQIDRNQGWGLANDSQCVLKELNKFGAETWMKLGDRDLATHIYRTTQRHQGVRPQEIVASIARAFGVTIPILLPTDQSVPTRLETELGWLPFQDYFVRYQCRPKVKQIDYQNASLAQATPEAIQAIRDANIIVLAPSNPILSLGAILAIPGIREAVSESQASVIGISPLIGGKAIKGPAAKIMQELGYKADALGVASYYKNWLDILIIDPQDTELYPGIEACGIHPVLHPILMQTQSEKTTLMTQTVRYALERLSAEV
jgi:LPPG:FO 2-phospho-L-lactate transferase